MKCGSKTLYRKDNSSLILSLCSFTEGKKMNNKDCDYISLIHTGACIFWKIWIPGFTKKLDIFAEYWQIAISGLLKQQLKPHEGAELANNWRQLICLKISITIVFDHIDRVEFCFHFWVYFWVVFPYLRRGPTIELSSPTLGGDKFPELSIPFPS